MAGRRKRRSMYVDDILTLHSKASCLCDLYIPEPERKFDAAGAVKEICLSGDDLNLIWKNRCVVHLCEIPFVPPEFVLTLEDTGQHSKVCLNVTLNRHKKGELQYSIKDSLLHECKQKAGTKWRKFLLRFDDTDANELTIFEEKLIHILSLVEEGNIGKSTYILVAVQVPSGDVVPKPNVLRKSLLDTKRESVSSNASSGTSRVPSVSEIDDSNIVTPNIQEKPFQSLAPPFEPAPWVPPADVEIGNSADTSEYNKEPLKTPKPHTSLFIAENSPLCDSLHIHPDELPRKFVSIVNSIDKEIVYNPSGYYEHLNSEFLLTDDLYVPMGVQRNMAANTSTQNAKMKDAAVKTAKLLQTAINDGDQGHAKEYAAQLAAEDVMVTIEVRPKEVPEKDQEFILKVYVEDKDTSGGSITLKVKPTDTIRDLKNRMLMKHMFPVEVQSWIIGKRIPADTETLAHCKVKSTGHSAYLYLSSAQSVGLNQAEFQERCANMFAQVGHPGAFSAQGTDVKLANDVGPPVTPANLGGRPASQHSPTPPPAAHNVKQEPAVQRPPPPKPAHKPVVNTKVPNTVTKKTTQELLGRLAGMTLTDDFSHVDQPHLLGAGDGRRLTVAEMPFEEAPAGWACSACTFINQPTRPGCELCANPRPPDYKVPDEYVISEEEKQRLKRETLLEKQAEEAEARRVARENQERVRNYQFLQDADALDLIPNADEFTCPICFEDIEAGNGVVLRECLHSFCKDCLSYAVQYAEDAVLTCPYKDEAYTCGGTLQDREIKALVTPQMYDRYLARSLKTAESQAANSFHCKTADCPGWCIYEDHVNFFVCPVCQKENCLTCKAIHQGMNCKEYQEDLRIRARNDHAAGQTHTMIRKMLDDGDAMNCPQCQVIVMKKEGCDWIQCSICKTEICWVTKGTRWGPLGNGDISGGCKCRVNGQTCHPNCNNCH